MQRPLATSSWERPGRERVTLGRRASPGDRGSKLRYREASPGLKALWLPGRFGCGHGHGVSSAGEQRSPDCGGGGDQEDCLLAARSFSVRRANASRAYGFFGSLTLIPAASVGSAALTVPRLPPASASTLRVDRLPSPALPEPLPSACPEGGGRCSLGRLSPARRGCLPRGLGSARLAPGRACLKMGSQEGGDEEPGDCEDPGEHTAGAAAGERLHAPPCPPRALQLLKPNPHD